MKKIILTLPALLIFTFAAAQEMKTGFQTLLSQLNDEQLHIQQHKVNQEIFKSSLISAGGLALVGLGGSMVYVGIRAVSSEPIIEIDPDNDLMMMMWPLVLSVYALQYLGGYTLIGNGLGLCTTGAGIIITASGNIIYQFDKTRQIQLELKRFQPVSYYDNPGYGIGISLPLNQKWHLR